MKRILLLFLTLFLLAALRPPAAVAASDPEPDSGAVVCPPGVYDQHPEDCVPLGPAQFLAEMAEAGVPYPVLPLPSYPPDPSLGNVPFSYFRVDDAGTLLFSSLGDAVGGGSAGMTIGPGQVLYVSYAERIESEGGIYYYLRDGGYIRGAGSRVALPYPFQGLLFSETPRNAFGWVLDTVESRRAPGFGSPGTGASYWRFQVVQVFATRSVDGVDWLMIAPGEWLEDRVVGVVDPDTVAPQGVTGSRWISVNLHQQTIAVYAQARLVFASMVSSGVDPYWTQPGLFQITEKKDTETMQGTFEADRSDFYYLQDVPWTMYFDGRRALHGAYWHSFFGYPRSHGCVNLSLGDSHWLYDWAGVGEWVYVFDPSGQTPTDPALYGAGAP